MSEGSRGLERATHTTRRRIGVNNGHRGRRGRAWGHGRGNVPITSEVTVYTRATAAREESEVLVCTHHAFDTSPQSAVYPALGEMGMQKDADAADADAEQMQSSRRRPGSGPSRRAAMGHEVHGVRWDGSGPPLLVRRRTSGGQQESTCRAPCATDQSTPDQGSSSSRTRVFHSFGSKVIREGGCGAVQPVEGASRNAVVGFCIAAHR